MWFTVHSCKLFGKVLLYVQYYKSLHVHVEKPDAIKMHVVVAAVKTMKGRRTVGAKVEMLLDRTASGFCFYVLYY